MIFRLNLEKLVDVCCSTKRHYVMVHSGNWKYRSLDIWKSLEFLHKSEVWCVWGINCVLVYACGEAVCGSDTIKKRWNQIQNGHYSGIFFIRSFLCHSQCKERKKSFPLPLILGWLAGVIEIKLTKDIL